MSLIDKGPSQNVSNGSTALQAQHDINIKTGLSAQDVKVIFEILFENQFPKIQDIAKQQAIQNGKSFQAKVISDLHQNSERIIIEKFKDPDVQALLNDALMSASRKGDKAHPDLLSKLIIEKVSSGRSDLKDIAITEAINVIPKLTSHHINVICGVFIIKNLMISRSTGEAIYALRDFHDKFENKFGVYFKLSDINLNHISYTGACNYNDFMGGDAYEIYLKKYENFNSSSANEAKEKIKSIAPSIDRFLENIKESRVGGITLTSVGIAIAIATLKEIQDMDYSIWLE